MHKNIKILGVIVAILSLAAAEEKSKEMDLQIVRMSIEYASGEEKKIETIKIALFNKQYPLTTANFLNFCNGCELEIKNRNGEIEKKHLGYKDTPFHRIVEGFVIQGGDVESRNGYGSISSVGKHGEPFEDEKDQTDKGKDKGPERKHDQEGMVAMANRGANTNGSQFYITMAKPEGEDNRYPLRFLDGKHTVFGKVICGIEMLREIEQIYKSEKRIEKMPVIKDIKVTMQSAREEDIQKSRGHNNLFESEIVEDRSSSEEEHELYSKDEDRSSSEMPNKSIKTEL